VAVGDKITVYAPNNIQGIIEELKKEETDPKTKSRTLAELKNDVILPAELTVTGIFESGRYDYDANILLVPLFVAQELYGMAGADSVHGLSVRIADPYAVVNVKNALASALPEGVFAQTWIDRNSSRFDAVRLERNMMFFILFFIIIVAAFSVMNTLITVTVQKRREIGILKALGANVRQIVWVFLAQGMVVGFFGNAIGLALGMILIRFRNEFKDFLAAVLHIQIFPPSIYEFTEIPAEVVPRDVAVICISAFVICSVAALIPAYFAARLDPVKALRYE
jgi:lipoprotein-releasing system permease protein